MNPRPANINGNPAPRIEDELSIGVLRIACSLFSRVYHTLDLQTPCPIPRHGPGIVVCNHISGLDPVLIQSTCQRRVIIWMMAEEYFQFTFLKPVFDAIRIIPVERKGRDSAALREGLRALKSGMVLGIFPEGRISPTDELLPFQSGVAMIAQKTGVPIYPAYIDGTQRRTEMPQCFLRRQHSTLRFGAPFKLSPHPRTEAASADPSEPLRIAIETLRQQSLQAKTENFRLKTGPDNR